MRQGKSHYRMTKGLFPGIPGKVIREINHLADNPPRQHQIISRAMGATPFDGLYSQGHRRYGHDPLTGMMILQKYGTQGLMAYFAHLAEDYANDVFVRRYGADTRDIIEAGFNIGYKNRKQR